MDFNPYQIYHWICSPIQLVVFSFCWWLPLLCKSFFICFSPVYFFVFVFIFLAWGHISEKTMLQEMSEILLPRYSSKIFMVLSLTFKFFILFEFILVCGVRRWSSFRFFACICSIFPTPFIELTIFTPLYVFASFVKY